MDTCPPEGYTLERLIPITDVLLVVGGMVAGILVLIVGVVVILQWAEER